MGTPLHAALDDALSRAFRTRDVSMRLRKMPCACRRVASGSGVDVHLCARHRDDQGVLRTAFEQHGYFAVGQTAWAYVAPLDPIGVRLFSGERVRGQYLERVVVALLWLRKAARVGAYAPRNIAWKALLRAVHAAPEVRAVVETICDLSGYPGTNERVLGSPHHPLMAWACAHYPHGPRRRAGDRTGGER